MTVPTIAFSSSFAPLIPLQTLRVLSRPFSPSGKIPSSKPFYINGNGDFMPRFRHCIENTTGTRLHDLSLLLHYYSYNSASNTQELVLLLPISNVHA